MSTKTKLTSLIITFILLASLLIVGVFAATQANFNVGGSITFNTKGINARISLVGTEGLTYNDGKMTEITLNDDMSKNDVQEAFSAWTGLELEFETGVTTATITLKIENLSDDAQNFIGVSLSSDNGTAENCNVSVKVEDNTYASCIYPGENFDFIITFNVEDPRYKASLTDFVVDFDMEKVQERTADVYKGVLVFTDITGSTNEVSVKHALSGTEAISEFTDDIKIPAYVKTGTTVYAVTEIEYNAFSDCDNDYGISSETILISSAVRSIGDYAFYINSNLANTTIPSSVTSIGVWAFSDCDALTSMEIPYGVTSIGEGTFYGAGLTGITIPSSVTSIGSTAFSMCESLTSVEIPSSVTSIGEGAFRYCERLESITIPSSVTSIYDFAFDSCANLTDVYYTGTEEEWSAITIGVNNTYLTDATKHYNQ